MEELGENKKKNFDFSRYYPLFFTIIFVFILFQYSFATLEAIFYDLRARFDFGIRFNEEIITVVMDEESDQYLGESYPYTYVTHRHLFEKLAKDNPKIINYFVSMPGPLTEVERSSSKEFKKVVRNYIDRGGYFRFGTDVDTWGEQLPLPNLAELGHSFSIINVDSTIFAKDDVSRRAILNISGEDSLHLWTANTYRNTLGLAPIGAGNFQGSYYFQEADATFALFRYYINPHREKARVRSIPYHRVRVGNFPKGFFKDKIVLVGPAYISNAGQFVLSPFNREDYKASKMNMHATIIQALIQAKTVYSVPKLVSYILALVIAIFLSVTISRMKPTHGLLITVILMVSILILSYLLFSLYGIWLYVTHLVLTVFVVYYIWVPFRAIGEYQRRFAIQEETKLLKKVENLKQNFISLMSHDLKTPVAKIAGLADIMLKQRQFNSAEGEKNICFIIDSTRELNKFISSILDLTKIESRNLTLNMTSKDINKAVEQAVLNLRYEASQKNIKVLTDLGPLYPIQYDPKLMDRVLSNLIENALKYSGEKAIVEVRTWDDDKWVYVEIKDNGIGIPSEDLEHIFDKFYRVKNDASHSIKGSGLGLFLVKYFVELHGGTIVADSTVGKGTKFQITLKNR